MKISKALLFTWFVLLFFVSKEAFTQVPKKSNFIHLSPEAEARFMQVVEQIQTIQGKNQLVRKITKREFQKFPDSVKKVLQKEDFKRPRIFKNPKTPSYAYAGTTNIDFLPSCSTTMGLHEWSMPGLEARVYYGEVNERLPADVIPEEVLVEELGYSFSGSYTVERNERIRTEETERLCTIIERGGTLEFETRTIPLNANLPIAGSTPPPRISYNDTEGNRWEGYDLEAFFVVKLDPNNEVSEFGQCESANSIDPQNPIFVSCECNGYLFEWAGLDNLETPQEDIPAGFYALGYWCPRSDE